MPPFHAQGGQNWCACQLLPVWEYGHPPINLQRYINGVIYVKSRSVGVAYSMEHSNPHLAQTIYDFYQLVSWS